MATEADLIQKFKDLNIPVGADFEELIHAAFAGANLADLVNNYDSRITTVENDLATKADDSKVVHTTDTSNWQKQAMFNPGSYRIDSTKDFATLLRSKYNKPGVVYIRDSTSYVDAVVISEGVGWWYAYGVKSSGGFVYRIIRESDDTGWVINADDSKVAHLSGANNFDTVPTVNNNPLLLASSLPSDLARTSQQTNFTAGLQSNGTAVATQTDVTTAVNTATENMADTTKADLNNYYHANASDDAALSAAKLAKVPGIFWFEEV